MWRSRRGTSPMLSTNSDTGLAGSSTSPSQQQRQIRFQSPLGPDVLLFERMAATEQLSQPFNFEVTLLSKRPDIRGAEVLGKRGTVILDYPGGGSRYFNGFICRFEYGGVEGDFTVYRASLRPWLWLLTRNADCRIFQDKTVPEIIRTVFQDRGFSADFENKLMRSYRKWTYCVQYRETDFNFVSRLMEQEGIYYYFKHDQNRHTMVLVDSTAAHTPFGDYADIAYVSPERVLRKDQERIDTWEIAREIQPGVY